MEVVGAIIPSIIAGYSIARSFSLFSSPRPKCFAANSSRPPLDPQKRRCGHCTRFASTYELVAKQLHSDHIKAGVTRHVNVAKIDGAAERALSSRFDVHGYPSFFLVDGWTVREFKGNRSHEGLVQFALSDYDKTDPVPFVTGPFGPMGQLRSFLMRSGSWIVGLYENLTRTRGMRPLMAMSALCVGGLAVGLVSIVILGVLFLPKAKLE
jgi:hypothetical protein